MIARVLKRIWPEGEGWWVVDMDKMAKEGGFLDKARKIKLRREWRKCTFGRGRTEKNKIVKEIVTMTQKPDVRGASR